MTVPVFTWNSPVSGAPEGVENWSAVRTELQLRRHRITPAEYPAFREFLRDVDAKLEQDFEVVPAK